MNIVNSRVFRADMKLAFALSNTSRCDSSGIKYLASAYDLSEDRAKQLYFDYMLKSVERVNPSHSYQFRLCVVKDKLLNEDKTKAVIFGRETSLFSY